MLQAIIRDFQNNWRSSKSMPDVRDVRSEDDDAFLEESRPVLERLEVFRKEKHKVYVFRKKIAVPFASVSTPLFLFIDYWLLMLQSGSDDRGAGLTILALGALYAWVTQPRRQYVKEYKQSMLPKIAKLFGDFYYELEGKIDLAKMQPSKILPKHDRYDSEDYFSGAYRGVGIEFCEVDFKQKRRSKNRTYYVSIFKGLAILLDMKSKKFYGHTMLDKDKGKISEWFKQKSSKLKRANLVDPEFEKVFDVYTNDQVEARYLVDPVMMERLKGLQDEYDGESMTAAFYDNKMFILIQSKHNHFEPASLDVPATDSGSILSMKKEIEETLSLIDRLSLYDPQQVHENKSVEIPDNQVV